MNFKEFSDLAKKHKTIPVYKRVMADLLTPISVYMKLKKKSDYSFIFESVEHGNQYGRYSFIGRDPQCILRSIDNVTQKYEEGVWNEDPSDFLHLLRNIQSRYDAPKLSGLPNFSGGLVGYLGYESIVWTEKIPIHGNDMLQCPDAVFMLFHELIAFDHLQNQIILFSNVQINDETNLEKSYDEAINKIDQLGEALHVDINFQTDSMITHSKSKLTSDYNKEDFKEAILKVKEHRKKRNSEIRTFKIQNPKKNEK